MFNSVAKYLWGSSSDVEQVTASHRPEDSAIYLDGGEHHDAVEQLETQSGEDDWEIVGTARELRSDKENEESIHRSSHHHHPHHHHNHRHHHPTSSGSSSYGPATEAEVLDDAAALAQSLSLSLSDKHVDDSDFDNKREHFTEPEPVTPLQDCALTNMDLDSNYSSDTESSPESVFSACSGRSHATYRPGSSSEAWVIAPAPCFTGSQVGELSPIASSPLENLLIEHPSMSVYLSVPPSSLPASHPFLSNGLSSGSDNETAIPASNEDEEVEDRDRESTPVSAGQDDRATARVGRLWAPHNPVHTTPATLEQMLKIEHAARRSQRKNSQNKNSSVKIERENKVHQTPTKSKNRRNKDLRPSGMKASRFNQRV